MHKVKKLMGCESGATAIEYAFLLGLTTAVVLAAISAFGSQTQMLFQSNAENLDKAL